MQQSGEVALQPGALSQGSLSRWLQFAPSRNTRSPWPELSALFVYVALVASAIPYHEPFADEAQAWQLARTLSLGSLFKTYIRYEGSPGLWYLLLWTMNRLHISYAGLHWVSGLIATAAVSLLVFKSPFPRYLKLLLPFTYFLLFQYAVVARNYVLAPLLLFLIAILWKRSTFGTALALGLLANVSLHTAVLSGGLALVYAVELVRNREGKPLPGARKLLFCGLLLLALYAFAIWTAWPPPDLALSRVRDLSSFFLRLLGALVLAICDPIYLSIPFWIVIALWFYARGKLLYLLPVLLFALFCGEVQVAFWHAGLLVPFLVCLLWITWPAPGSHPDEFERVCGVALIVMIATQIVWSGYALFYDRYHAYSPDPQAAGFIKPYVDEHAAIAVTYLKSDSFWRGRAFTSVGILPYFDRNIYANTPYSFWWWSDRDPSEARFDALLPSHPQIVLVEQVSPRPVAHLDMSKPEFSALMSNGYQYRATFCGSQPQGLELGVTICHVFFEYSGRRSISGLQAQE